VSILSRLYDFISGTPIRSQQVDDEFNQLINGHNDQENRLVNVEANKASTTEVQASIDQVEAYVDQVAANFVLGQVSAGSVTDEMLSNDPSAVKQKITLLSNVPAGQIALSNLTPVATIEAKVNGGLEFEFEAPELKVSPNLLGRPGACDSLEGWVSNGSGVVTVDTVVKKDGIGSLKWASNNNNEIKYKDVQGLDSTKYYALVSEVYISAYTSGKLNAEICDYGAFTNATGTEPNYAILNTWQRLVTKFTGKSAVRVTLGGGSNSTRTGNIDNVMLIEISAAEYADANYTPPAFSYGIQSLMGLNLKVDGENEQLAELLIDAEFAGIGTALDTFSYKNGVAKATRKVKKVVLDGSLAWQFNEDFAGCKGAYAPIPFKSIDRVNGKIVKYDGKAILAEVNTTTFDKQWLSSGFAEVYINISDTDSGWGEGYTPTSDEIKAYFNGWKMYNGTAGTTPYNGTGTKSWGKIYCGVGSQDAGGLGVVAASGISACPITLNDMGYTPYKLWYVLAEPYEEVLDTPINNLAVFEGQNTITLATGVVRESINPVLDTGNYYINLALQVSSRFKYKSKVIKAVLKNNNIDADWVVWDASDAYGVQRAHISQANYDPTATYEVIYEVLPDEYNHGEVSFTAEYTESLVDSHNELVEQVAHMQDEVEGKASKLQEQPFSLTGVNGWVPSSGIPIKCWKDEFGIVHINGELNNGTYTAGTVICVLPVGYRPFRDLVERATKVNDNSSVRIDIAAADGKMYVYGLSSTGIIYINAAFRAK
jgi:hypothetical protein